jgi:hypothetical protein
MSIFLPFALLLNLLFQAGGAPSPPGDIFTPAERAQFEKAAKIENRIKIYEKVSVRLQQELEAAVTKEEFQTVPGILNAWNLLLTRSLEDIETNLKAKKKPRALINFEIQLRKSIDRTQNLKIRTTADLQDAFDSCMQQAEKVRRRFVEILFRS